MKKAPEQKIQQLPDKSQQQLTEQWQKEAITAELEEIHTAILDMAPDLDQKDKLMGRQSIINTQFKKKMSLGQKMKVEMKQSVKKEWEQGGCQESNPFYRSTQNYNTIFD